MTDRETTALARARSQYGAAPRTLDAVLEQLARGDRGCFWLGISGVGVLTTVVVAIASLKGLVDFTWAYAGLAVWIGGTFMGARAQTASEGLRRASLESAPLVAARVVVADPHLSAAGKQAGRALVVFSETVGGEALLRLAERARVHENTELATMRADRFAPGPRAVAEFGVPVPSESDDSEASTAGESGVAWLAWIVIDPLRLPQRRLPEHHAELALIADVKADVIEHV